MTTFPVGNPYPIILGLDGVGLDGGSAYIGLVNQDPISFPQAVYWDAALTIPASQPLQIDAGYFYYLGSPAAPYVAARYSITVLDAQGVLVFTNLAVGSALASGPTIQKFLSGTGTYTTPAGVTWIEIEMVGGGGGGGGGGSTTLVASVGGPGGATTFGAALLVANGGLGGHAGGNGTARAGGTASLGTGPVGIALQGASGQAAPAVNGDFSNGGMGASSPFGGAGGGGTNFAGQAATPNTGSGGGGGGTGSPAVFNQGGGGGTAGGYVKAIILSPAASYSYAIGAAGTGGSSSGSAMVGGLGGSGIIIVTEHYAS